MGGHSVQPKLTKGRVAYFCTSLKLFRPWDFVETTLFRFRHAPTQLVTDLFDS